MVLRVLLLNGPPRSGKDTLCNMLLEQHVLNNGARSVHSAKFAEPIKDHFAASWGVSREWIEENKDKVFMHGVTVRQMLIAYSESYMKPLFGLDIFGKLMFKRLAEIEAENKDSAACPAVVISDSGFAEEARVVIDAGHEVHLVRLHRDGFDFTGDSRGYLGVFNLRNLREVHDVYANDLLTLHTNAVYLYENLLQ